MDRRVGGLLIVLLVVLSAVILPGLVGRTVVGNATLAPIPGPPAVGECLTVPEVTSWTQGPRPTYAPQSLAACHGSRFGEVVAVIHDARSREPVLPTIQTPSDGSSVIDDPNQLTCSDAVSRYLGLHLGADHDSTVSDDWLPMTQIESSPSGPGVVQKKFGQDWVACVVFVSNTGGSSIAYPGSLKDAYVTGEVPAAFALCLSAADVGTAEVLPCNRPHQAEGFGVMTTARPGLTQQSLDLSCRALVSRLTKLSDPTAGGQLEVKVTAAHVTSSGQSVAGLGKADDQTGFAGCTLVARPGRQLGGTVLALHGGPIPWAP